MKTLIVESHNETGMLLEQVLSLMGHNPILCLDAATAYREIERENFPIVIVDQVLPDMDGLDFCRLLKSRNLHTPLVIAMIAASYPDDTHLLDSGVDELLLPPLDAKTISLRMRILQKRAAELARENQKDEMMQILAKALETMQLGVTITSADGTILYTNPADARMHGYDKSDLIGKSARLFSPSSHWKWLTMEEMNKLQSWKRESVNVRKDGTLFPVQLLSDVVRNAEQHAVALVTTCEDVTDRKRTEELLRDKKLREERLLHDAFHDPLTGLPNRALFLNRLTKLLQQPTEEGRAVSVLFLDLDFFKEVNDQFGHLCGDVLLKKVADRIVDCLRPGDTVARVGGDEFTILLSGMRSEQDALNVAQRIQEEFFVPFEVEGRSIPNTVSIGIAFSSETIQLPEDLLRAADAAMYRAKAHGRARSEIFGEIAVKDAS